MLLWLLLVTGLTACSVPRTQPIPGGPRLVVLVSFDQYRGDFPQRFQRIAGNRGFQRLMSEGAWFSRCLLDYATTQTGPGHATLLTGCNPGKTGITANDMCDRQEGYCVYCARTPNGIVSPYLLRVPTVGDQLRTLWPDSKVVGLALKDRAAVLMAGHSPTAAVFLDFENGRFTTSDYYPKPSWLSTLADSISMLRCSGFIWNSEVPESVMYAEDDVPWERTFSNQQRTFPHTISDGDTASIVSDATMSPFSMDVLFDAFHFILRMENMGADNTPDVFAIGVSSTDLLGHHFGPDSKEVMEMYVHADRFVEKLIDTLDAVVGREHYQLVVTSDHGIAPIPELLLRHNQKGVPPIDAGRLPYALARNITDSILTQQFGRPPQSWVWEVHLPHVYLNDASVQWSGLNRDSVARIVAKEIAAVPGIGVAIASADITKDDCKKQYSSELCALLRNDVAHARTGDIIIYPKPYWIFGTTPATHGSPWEYDRWVPLFWFGGNVAAREHKQQVSPADIAPTMAKQWGITLPEANGRTLLLR